jgi:hypothetical protein
MSLSQTPAYNLKVVLKETGIAADTLRAWERRYGIPMPQRTPGGHRLYSQHDIHLIKWLMARQKEGLSISRAVDHWQELLASGTDPLAGEQGSKPMETSASPLATGSLEDSRLEWLYACQAYNEAGAEQALNQAFALYPVETVVTELIQAGLHEMGGMWQRGQASVQQEHFASALAGRRLEALIAAAPPPTRPEAILLACPAEEWHAFPLLLLSLLLKRRGWNTVYLGANVPLEEMEETIQTVRPALVIMAAQGLVSAAALRESAALVANHGTPVAFGGQAFNLNPELRELIPGEFMGETIQQASGRIEALLEGPRKRLDVPAPERTPLAQAYRLHRPRIEASMSAGAEGADYSADESGLAGIQLGKVIGAALELGQVEYARAELDWVRSLLAGRGRPAESMSGYVSAYAQAVRITMGPIGSPIADWLDRYLSGA